MSGENHPMCGKTGENHPRFGISLTDNVITNMKEAQKKIDRTGIKNPRGMLGLNHSPDTLVKMSLAKGGGTIYIYDTHGSLVNSFHSARKAAEFLKTDHQVIMRYLRSGKVFKEQWILSTSFIDANQS